MSSQTNIAFIGAGNMASSLIGGLLQGGYAPQAIWATRRNTQALTALATRFGVHTTTDNHTAIKAADVIVLAVKPQNLQPLCQTIADMVQTQKPLVISIVAGIEQHTLQHWLGGNIAIVRCMPNTPALISCGASALYANAHVNAQQHDIAESIARAVGITVWLDSEQQMHTVTALSGGGPAYFYLFMEHLTDAAIAMGLPAKTAALLTLQTALGAAKLALESELSVDALRARVTSKNGTTEQALNTFDQKQLADIVSSALDKARLRSIALANEFSHSS